MKRALVLCLALGSLTVGACGGKSKKPATITTSEAPSRPRPPAARTETDPSRTATVTPDTPAGEDRPSFAPIRFDFDSTTLSDEARAELQAISTWMTNNQARLTIEGHADERGTTEYNLALGQARADAIARHLIRLGVTEARLKTITFGEERPAVSGSDDAAWAANRRGQLEPDR